MVQFKRLKHKKVEIAIDLTKTIFCSIVFFSYCYVAIGIGYYIALCID